MATIAEELAKAAVTDSLIRIENPIAAPWVKMNPGTTAGKCQTTALAEGYTPVTTFAGGEDDCYYSTSAFASSSTTYIYAIVTLSRIGSNERQTGVWLCRDEGTPVTVQNGYYLRMEKKAAAGEIKYTIEKWVAGTPEVIKEFTTTEYVVGSQIAFVVGNGTAYMFGRVVEGSGEFAEKMSIATSTYAKGYSGLRGKGTGEMVVKNFRAGTFTLAPAEKVRQFTNSPASKIVLGLGSALKSLSTSGWTIAVLVKLEAEAGTLFGVYNSIDGRNFSPSLECNFAIPLFFGSEPKEAASCKIPLNEWALVIGTKEKGVGEFGKARPRYHIFNISKKSWIHRDAAGEVEEGQANKWDHGRIGALLGKIAAVAVWKSSLSDAQCEALGAAAQIGEWPNAVSPPPVDMWALNQQSVAEEIKDMIGSAHQTSREETSVASEAPPVPYGTLGKFVYTFVGGVIKAVRRWLLVKGELISK